jgi:hypothetical protein
MKKWLLALLLLPILLGAAPQLSPQSEIRVITCGPYQGELYSAFGHSAIYVKDAATGTNRLYNYGVFNFNQPNFYLNFAKGHLNYRLAVMDYDRFVQSYIHENRFVHEQVLNLDASQKQRLYDFLEWNAQDENMYYMYDYFYDNCATRIRDALKHTFGDSISFDASHISTSYSIRDLCDIYLQQQPWGDAGIDLCLGLPMDKAATPWMYMFLPDYVEAALNNAYIKDAKGTRPLVQQTIVTYEAQAIEKERSFNTPLNWLTGCLTVGLLITFWGYKRGKPLYIFDVALFTLVGLLGWFLLALWLATDHKAAAQNMNILWALPLHFPLALFLLKKSKPRLLRLVFGLSAALNILLLVFWVLLPQDLNNDFIPLVLLLAVRSFHLFKRLGRPNA